MGLPLNLLSKNFESEAEKAFGERRLRGSVAPERNTFLRSLGWGNGSADSALSRLRGIRIRGDRSGDPNDSEGNLQKPDTFYVQKGTGTYLVGHGQVAVIDPGPPLDSHLEDI